MADPQHPITPPPELLQEWINDENGLTAGHIATQAARWGADQELEACCALIGSAYVRDRVRAARRPKPPSVAEEALNAAKDMSDCMKDGMLPNRSSLETIRAALERLQELENNG